MVWAPRRLAREKPFAILCSGVCCSEVIITSGQSSKPFGRRFGKARSVRERKRERERENWRQPLSLAIALSLPRRNASRGKTKKRGNETRRTETVGADPRLETSTTTQIKEKRCSRPPPPRARTYFLSVVIFFPHNDNGVPLGICASPPKRKKVTHASSSSSSSSSSLHPKNNTVGEERERERERETIIIYYEVVCSKSK